MQPTARLAHEYEPTASQMASQIIIIEATAEAVPNVFLAMSTWNPITMQVIIEATDQLGL